MRQLILLVLCSFQGFSANFFHTWDGKNKSNEEETVPLVNSILPAGDDGESSACSLTPISTAIAQPGDKPVDTKPQKDWSQEDFEDYLDRYIAGRSVLFGYLVTKDFVLNLPYFSESLSQDMRYLYWALKNDYKAIPMNTVALALAKANSGDALGYVIAGMCSENGIKIQKNLEQAYTYYQVAANCGVLIGQVKLAHAYRNGLGVKKNLDLAFHWYQKAATAGHALGQYRLWLRYKKGEGCKEDINEATKWITLSAQQANRLAMYELAKLQEDNDESVAFLWYQKAATFGYELAQRDTIRCLKEGIGTTKSLPEALACILQYQLSGPTKDYFSIASSDILVPASDIATPCPAGETIQDAESAEWLTQCFAIEKELDKSLLLIPGINPTAQYLIDLTHIKNYNDYMHRWRHQNTIFVSFGKNASETSIKLQRLLSTYEQSGYLPYCPQCQRHYNYMVDKLHNAAWERFCKFAACYLKTE